MDKCDHLKFIIERFDHYYDAANSKGSFYIALNTFILGGICVGYLSLLGKVNMNWMGWLLAASLMAFCFASVYFTVMALIPFLKDNGEPNAHPSLLYFGGIARHELQHFREKIDRLDENAIKEDLTKQAHCLSQGLKKKYDKLKHAGWCIIAQFLILLPLLLFIFKNLTHENV